MSLMRLLTLGHCLNGRQESISRYRLPKQNLLPKFGPIKTPNLTSERTKSELIQAAAGPKLNPPSTVCRENGRAGCAQPAARASASRSAEDSAPYHSSPEENGDHRDLSRTAVRIETKPIVVKREKNTLKILGNVRVVVVRAAASGRRWLMKLYPFAVRSARKTSPNFSAAKTKTTPVQTELSLDQVKVVRNDLSDADLEVVPMRTISVPVEANRTLEPMIENEPAGKMWGRLSARIFGPEQTQSR